MCSYNYRLPEQLCATVQYYVHDACMFQTKFDLATKNKISRQKMALSRVSYD